MKKLDIYNDYNREEVHDIFANGTAFKQGTGTWGLQGIIKVPDRSNDYVFFVTFGQKHADHVFDEGITEDGILTWQSQPKQKLNTNTIQNLINHNHMVNNIYLFLRTKEGLNYTYLGKLAYVNHDIDREEPVYFKWQIIDWEVPIETSTRMGLVLLESHQENVNIEESVQFLTQTPPPEKTSPLKGSTTREFRGKKVNFAETTRENKKLGTNGELLVFQYEKQFLINNNRLDLAEKVVHTSEVIGDGTGYDIESYDLNGQKIFIEVKTTCGDKRTPFIMSINEIEFGKTHANQYLLCRVYDYDKKMNTAKFYCVKGSVLDSFNLTPIQYRVSY